MVIIYTKTITPRILYITKFIFNELLGTEVTVTSNLEEFNTSPYVKINYSDEKVEGISVRPVMLLYEKGVRNLKADTGNFEGIPVLFMSYNFADIPFDPFAASFFLISRYEEYLPQQLDLHGRIKAEESVAYINKFLNIPVVDHWALIIKKEIEKRYPWYSFPARKYSYIPTIDVDVAYAYKFRKFFRVAGATVKSVLKRDSDDFTGRIKTLWFKHQDPFDTYDFACDLFEQYGFEPVFFFLLGRYGKFDKNISSNNIGLIRLIERIHNKYQVGIHPSYGSNYDMTRLNTEIKLIENITKQAITKSRQHFLKLKIPETYRNLISIGIKEDYTMGYASQAGFRAGTCTPFHFYDLSSETESNLTVFPFQVMDGTLNQYLGLSIGDAIQVIKNIIDEVKKVNGTFISLWHNESLSETRNWKGWREVYIAMAREAAG